MVMDNALQLFQIWEKQLISCKPISWTNLKEIPRINGVYMICHIGYPNIVYIGESKDIFDRIWKHHRTGNCSAFRSNLQKYYSANKNQPIDVQIKQFLDECVVKYVELPYGRKEFEEYLITKYNPKYNRQGTIKCKNKV